MSKNLKHLQNSNFQNGNPIEIIRNQFDFHILASVLEPHDIFFAYSPCDTLTFITSLKLKLQHVVEFLTFLGAIILSIDFIIYFIFKAFPTI